MLNNDPIDSSFQKFIGGPTPGRSQTVRITLNRQSHIYFNRRAFEALGKPANVYLYYSSLKEEILIERTEYRHSPAFPVLQKQNGWMIQAAPFCRNHRIRPGATKRFVDPNFGSGRVYLNLQRSVIVDRGSRKQTT